MTRILLGAVVIYAAVALYSLFDAAMRDKEQIRVMPKLAWMAVILFVPLVGLILWFLFGRGTTAPAPRRGVAPDDDPEYLRKIAEDLEKNRDMSRGDSSDEDHGPESPHER